MGLPGAACDRCGTSLAAHDAWTLVQDDARSTLCGRCAVDVGPALARWPRSELVPPPARPEGEGGDARSTPGAADDDGGGWAFRHPIVWLFGSLLLLALALAPFVFFYWLASR